VVKAAVVHAQPDGHGELRLVAYVVAAQRKTATISELRRELGRTLPEVMIPSSFVFLEAFPLLPNGKIDRRALPIPGVDRPVLPVPYAAPRDLTESTLAAIWMEVLQLERIGINDRFLDLGGDSLRATQILGRTVKSFGIELSVRDLIRTETIAQMAELISTRHAAGDPL
jgi:acyl carrier protein